MRVHSTWNLGSSAARRTSAYVFALALAIGGCAPTAEFERVETSPANPTEPTDASTPADAGASDAATVPETVDDAGLPEIQVDAGPVSPCPPPNLFVPSADGVVHRYQLGITGPTACDALETNVTSLAAVTVSMDGILLAVGATEMRAFDIESHALLWTRPMSDDVTPPVVDVVAAQHPDDGQTVFALGLEVDESIRRIGRIERILLLDAHGDRIHAFEFKDLPTDLGALTLAPADHSEGYRSKLLAYGRHYPTSPSSNEARLFELDILSMTPLSHQSGLGLTAFDFISSFEASSQSRLLIGSFDDLMVAPTIYDERSVIDFHCGPCNVEGLDRPRLHGVPDPTSNQHSYLVCQREGTSTRSVVRVDHQAGACDVVRSTLESAPAGRMALYPPWESP